MLTIEKADSRYCDACGIGTDDTKAIRCGPGNSTVTIKLCRLCRIDLKERL